MLQGCEVAFGNCNGPSVASRLFGVHWWRLAGLLSNKEQTHEVELLEVWEDEMLRPLRTSSARPGVYKKSIVVGALFMQVFGLVACDILPKPCLSPIKRQD